MILKGKVWKFGDNIDTDAIIPARYLNTSDPAELAKHLMEDADKDFPSKVKKGDMIIAQYNFGCGSSREHAVWALGEYGVRAIIAPGFGAIFANNCVRNGLLPVELDATAVQEIATWVAQDPTLHQLVIDLPAQEVHAVDQSFRFEIEPGAKRMLVQGLDAIALTLTRWELISAFHQQRLQLRPWLY